jgi:hypothetical protein
VQQTNVIEFPLRQIEADRMRLYRDEPCTILVLAAARIALKRSPQSAVQPSKARRVAFAVPSGNSLLMSHLTLLPNPATV